MLLFVSDFSMWLLRLSICPASRSSRKNTCFGLDGDIAIGRSFARNRFATQTRCAI